MKEAETAARAALAAAGRPIGPLELLRLRPGRAAAFRSGGAFVKVHLGEGAEARAAAAHEGQARAAAIISGGAPLSPTPGPLSVGAFACDWLEAERFGDLMRACFAPARRAALLQEAGAAVAALHRSGGAPSAAFGGWPAERLLSGLAGAGREPWRGFAGLAGQAAGALHEARGVRFEAGPAHGDLHAENLLVLRAGGLRLVDFAGSAPRPRLADVALLLVTVAARTPRLPPRRRGETGLHLADEAAFFAGYGPPPAPPRLLTLHILRVALAQGLLAADEARAGGGGGRRRRLARIRRLAGACAERLF